MSKSGPTTTEGQSVDPELKIKGDFSSHAVVIQKNEDTPVSLGNAHMQISKNSVMKTTETHVSYRPNGYGVPDGYSCISLTMSASPPIESRKYIRMTLPVFCIPLEDKEVNVTTFTGREGKWIKIQDHPLTTDGYLELYYMSIDNVTAFLPNGFKDDVEFEITFSVYRNDNGKVAIGICPPNEETELDLRKRLLNENFHLICDKIEKLSTKLDNMIAFGFGDKCRKIAAEQFLGNEGYVSYHDVDGSAEQLNLTIKQHANEADDLATPLFERTYDVWNEAIENAEQSASQDHTSTMTVRGDVKTEHFVKDVENLTLIKGQGAAEDDSDRDEPSIPREQSPKEPETEDFPRRGKGQSKRAKNELTIHGNLEAEDVIMNAGRVKIVNKGKEAGKGCKYKQHKNSPITMGSVQEVGSSGDMAVPTHRNCETEDGKRTPSNATRRRQINPDIQRQTEDEAPPRDSSIPGDTPTSEQGIVQRLRDCAAVYNLDFLHIASFAAILFLVWIIIRLYL